MLDDLMGTIETLKGRILEHREVLRGNRARTRAALADPMLRALSWDISDPAVTLADYQIGTYAADYALLSPYGDPAAIARVEGLENPLDRARGKLFDRARESDIAYICLTDGDVWELHGVDDRQIAGVSMTAAEGHVCALQLLGLWRPNIGSGEAQKAATLTIEESRNPPTDPEFESMPDLTEGWARLSEYNPPPNTPPPSAVRFPDGCKVDSRYWYDVFIHTATWLHFKGLLTREAILARMASGEKRPVAYPEPKRSGGKPLPMPHRIGEGVYVSIERKAQTMLSRARLLIEQFGGDPSKVLLKTGGKSG